MNVTIPSMGSIEVGKRYVQIEESGESIAEVISVDLTKNKIEYSYIDRNGDVIEILYSGRFEWFKKHFRDEVEDHVLIVERIELCFDKMKEIF